MKVLLVLNSPHVNSKQVIRYAADRAVLAVDGGVEHVLAAGLTPRWVIGDLDSAGPDFIDRARALGSRIMPFAVHKDYTDMELALNFVRRLGCKSLVVLGLTGGSRFDHQLTNFSLLGKVAGAGLEVLADCPGQRLIFTRQSKVLTRAGGQNFSLMALGNSARLFLKGCLYSGSIELRPGSGYGLGNLITESRTLIQIIKGIVCIARWGE